MTRIRKITAHYINCGKQLLKNRIITLAEDGTVIGLEECAEPDRVAGAEFYSGILVPGFVNSHCHLELSYMRGAIPPSGGYLGFAQGMSGMRNEFALVDRMAAVSAADAMMWRQGISAVADISNGITSFDTKSQSRIHYHTFLELFGLGSDISLDSSLASAEKAASVRRLDCSATPHSIYSLEDEAFRQAVEGFPAGIHDGKKSPLSVHFMESPEEALLFKKEGGMWDWYSQRGIVPQFVERYASPAERLVSLTPPDRDIMLIHDCCMTEEDYDIIADHFTGTVTWVLCPRSNKYITGLTPPVELLRRKGARIAVGTDSLASNHSLDMAAELREFSGVPLEELLGWATFSGAETLGLHDTLGDFRPGMKPGVTLLTGIDWQTMSLTPDSRSERIL